MLDSIWSFVFQLHGIIQSDRYIIAKRKKG